MSKKGFSLIELLVYVSIFAVVAGLMTAVLITILKVSQEESASVETSEQLSFVMQTVSRLIRESSNIEIASANSLKLRMKNSAKDPACLYLENQTIKIIEGPDPSNPQNCNLNASSSLTSAKVIADKLEFSKISNYPGHDVVSVDIQLTYNSNNPESRTTRNLKSAIARVSAATFDSNLLPGSTDKTIGQSGASWNNAYLADGSALSPSYTFGNDTSMGFFRADATNILGFATAGLERMIINSNGNVGIGTSTPAYKLAVDGAISVTGNSAVSGTGLTFGNYATGAYKWIQSFNSHPLYINPLGNNVLFNRDAGNVGIGTTVPNAKLQITGGDVYISTANNGLILKSPNGAVCRRVGIDNAGAALTLTPITCP